MRVTVRRSDHEATAAKAIPIATSTPTPSGGADCALPEASNALCYRSESGVLILLV